MRLVQRTLLVSWLIGVSMLLIGSTPAAADAPGPTDYRTEVKAIEPATDQFEIEIVGGDSFVLLRQRQPVTIEISGYNGEPYLRFLPDGTVEQNRRSPAVYLNEERYGTDELPAIADATASPEWEVVADGGSYAWHDHRAHWMLSSRPFGKEPGDQILEAVVPAFVDGVEVDIVMASYWQSAPSPVPFVAGAVAGLAGALVAWRRRGDLPLLLGVAAAGAIAIGWAQFRSVPSETGPSTSLLLLPGLALASTAAAWIARRRPANALPLVLGSAVFLAVFAWQRVPDSYRAILPTDLPFSVDRGVSVAVMIMAVGIAGVAAADFTRLVRAAPSAATADQ